MRATSYGGPCHGLLHRVDISECVSLRVSVTACLPIQEQQAHGYKDQSHRTGSFRRPQTKNAWMKDMLDLQSQSSTVSSIC
jgi:hypothetical protein